MATFANETTLRQTADFFKILGDPTRVKLLLLLSQNEYCVSELAEQTGMTNSAVSHQISLLRAKRLLRRHKSGKQVYYSTTSTTKPKIDKLIGLVQNYLN